MFFFQPDFKLKDITRNLINKKCQCLDNSTWFIWNSFWKWLIWERCTILKSIHEVWMPRTLQKNLEFFLLANEALDPVHKGPLWSLSISHELYIFDVTGVAIPSPPQGKECKVTYTSIYPKFRFRIQIFGKCLFYRYVCKMPLPHKFMDKFHISVLFARFSCTNSDIKWGKCVLDLDFNWNHCELILYLTFTFGTHVSWYYTYLLFGANVIWYYTQHLHLERMCYT